MFFSGGTPCFFKESEIDKSDSKKVKQNNKGPNKVKFDVYNLKTNHNLDLCIPKQESYL